MTIAVAQTKAILDTLPIGYYLGMKAPVILDEESSTSYVDMLAREIHISFNNVREGAKNVPEAEGAEWIVRSLLYHEVSHLLLTPIELCQMQVIPREATNLMEDARIGALLAHRFHGVDFPRLVEAVCGAEVDWAHKPSSIIDFMFRLLRFRRGPAALLNEWDDLVALSIKWDGDTLYTMYRRFYAKLAAHFKKTSPTAAAKNAAEEAAEAAAAAEQAAAAAREAVASSGSGSAEGGAEEAEKGDNARDAANAVENNMRRLTEAASNMDKSLHSLCESRAKREADGKLGEAEAASVLRKLVEASDAFNPTARRIHKTYEESWGASIEAGEDPSAALKVCKAAADAAAEEAESLKEIAEKLEEAAEALAAGEEEEECGGGRAPRPHPLRDENELTDAAFNKICSKLAKRMTEFTAPEVDAVVKRIILRVARKAGTKTGNSYGYSGRINPRAVGMRDDYRWLVKPGDSGAKNHSRLHMRLWCDVSGSFYNDIDTVNRLISALVRVEKSVPDLFKLTILLMGNENRLGDKRMRLEATEGNDFGPNVARLARATFAPGWKTIDVMVWDGELASDDTDVVARYPNAFKALDKPSTLIISDADLYNRTMLDKGCPSAKRTYISGSYAEQFAKTVLAALDCAL